MKKEDLFETLTDINETSVKNARNYSSGKKHVWAKWGSLVACAAVLFVVVVGVPLVKDRKQKEGNNNYGGITLASKKVHYKDLTPTLSSSNSNDFSGKAKADQSNSLKGQISVSVVKVYSNGNLQVQGEKWLMLNNGNEYVRVSGLIRPSDISSDNTVSSQRIANARIQYGGTGDFADTQERGFLSRLFNSAFNIFF